MADYDIDSAAGEIAVHEVLMTAGDQDVVTFVGKDVKAVEVISDGGDELYVSVDGKDASDKGPNCVRMPAGVVSKREIATRGQAVPTVVKLFSAGAPVYSLSEATSPENSE